MCEQFLPDVRAVPSGCRLDRPLFLSQVISRIFAKMTEEGRRTPGTSAAEAVCLEAVRQNGNALVGKALLLQMMH